MARVLTLETCIRLRESTWRLSSVMSVTCLPALRCVALNSLNPSTKFCMSSIVASFAPLLLCFWNSSTSSCEATSVFKSTPGCKLVQSTALRSPDLLYKAIE